MNFIGRSEVTTAQFKHQIKKFEKHVVSEDLVSVEEKEIYDDFGGHREYIFKYENGSCFRCFGDLPENSVFQRGVLKKYSQSTFF